MNTFRNKSKISNWLPFIFGAMLFVSFFLPWVSWRDEVVRGYAMSSGDFFKSSVAVSGPENPYPKLSFSFYIFWLIPVLAILSAVLVFRKKKITPVSYIAGTLSLALVTVYYLFSQTLATDFSVGKSVMGMLKPSFYLHALGAIGLIAGSFPAKTILPKIAWLLIGPVFAYTGYKMGENYIMSETHTATEKVQVDYTVNAAQLINEFITNDTATNKKYREKMLVVNGNTAAVEIQTDSTSTIKFADSTGSYVIFSFEKNEFDKVKTIKDGDPVSLKGVCSGSIFSDILGTTVITFKRSTLNKK